MPLLLFIQTKLNINDFHHAIKYNIIIYM